MWISHKNIESYAPMKKEMNLHKYQIFIHMTMGITLQEFLFLIFLFFHLHQLYFEFPLKFFHMHE